MKKDKLNQNPAPAALGRRKLLKTGGVLLAAQAGLGFATQAFAGRNGEVDTITLFDATKAAEKKEPLFKWGGSMASTPEVTTAKKEAVTPLIRPQDVQILFVDMQASLVAGSQTIKPQAVADAAGTLAKVARILNIPMTFAVLPDPGTRAVLIPELVAFSNDTNTFGRQTASPFMAQTVVDRLATNKRKILIISAYPTEVAGLQATLGAIAAGYTVHIPVDAIGSQSERTETVALRQMETAGAQTNSVHGLASMLAPDFSQRPGSEVFSVLTGRRAVKDSSTGW